MRYSVRASLCPYLQSEDYCWKMTMTRFISAQAVFQMSCKISCLFSNGYLPYAWAPKVGTKDTLALTLASSLLYLMHFDDSVVVHCLTVKPCKPNKLLRAYCSWKGDLSSSSSLTWARGTFPTAPTFGTLIVMPVILRLRDCTVCQIICAETQELSHRTTPPRTPTFRRGF